MGLITDVLKLARERERRLSAARRAIDDLTFDEKAAVAAELLEGLRPKVEKARGFAAKKPAGSSFTDVAESHVCARPGGSSSSEVAAVTGQSPSHASATLNHVARKRGTVESRGGRWYPTGKAPRLPVAGLRERISEALARGTLNVAGVHAAVERVAPGVASKATIAAEVERMRAEGLVTAKGRALVLANGGAH